MNNGHQPELLQSHARAMTDQARAMGKPAMHV